MAKWRGNKKTDGRTGRGGHTHNNSFSSIDQTLRVRRTRRRRSYIEPSVSIMQHPMLFCCPFSVFSTFKNDGATEPAQPESNPMTQNPISSDFNGFVSFFSQPLADSFIFSDSIHIIAKYLMYLVHYARVDFPVIISLSALIFLLLCLLMLPSS